MRLIDADKLIYQSHAQHIQPYINKKDIDNAPTVEMAEDCISRQALIEKATSWDKHFADSERYVSLTDIQGAPPVTPTRHHGDWEETVVLPRAYDIMGNKTWASQMRCNKCEFATFAVEGKFSQYNFCPNCGADMREVQDDGI